MHRKKVLLVGGCSHSCGAEIEGPRIYRSKYNVDNSFAGILAKDLNLMHVNVAVPGCSNKVIVANIVHHTNLLLTNHDPSEIFVLIGWTGFSRSEAIYNNTLHCWSAGSSLSPHWKHRPTVIKKIHELWKIFVSEEQYYYNDHVLNYQLLKSFLDHKNISYFFFNAVEALRYPQSMKNFLHANDSNNLDKVGFDAINSDVRYFFPFDEGKSFYFAMNNRHDSLKDGRWYHFTEDAHREWAEMIKPLLQIHD